MTGFTFEATYQLSLSVLHKFTIAFHNIKSPTLVSKPVVLKRFTDQAFGEVVTPLIVSVDLVETDLSIFTIILGYMAPEAVPLDMEVLCPCCDPLVGSQTKSTLIVFKDRGHNSNIGDIEIKHRDKFFNQQLESDYLSHCLTQALVLSFES